MPRIVRCALIQATCTTPTEESLEKIKREAIEKHLKLRFEFDDLHRLLGVERGTEAEIFGAVWLETGEIVIDESLDPEKIPQSKADIDSHLLMKAEGTGDCTGVWFRQTAVKSRSLEMRDSQPLSVARANPRSGLSCRRICMLRAC